MKIRILSEYAVILFGLKIKTSRRPKFRKDKMRSMVDVQSAFMRMDVNGDGTLTKREMLAADEFTQEEVSHGTIVLATSQLCCGLQY